MKTHRTHLNLGLNFLLMESASPPSATADGPKSALKPGEKSFESLLLKQSERLLQDKALAGDATPMEVSPSSKVVAISDRISLWLGPAGPKAIEIPREGLRQFGRDQGLSEEALEALLGRVEPRQALSTEEVTVQGALPEPQREPQPGTSPLPMYAAANLETLVPTPVGLPLIVATPLTTVPVPAESPAPSEDSAPLASVVRVVGWEPTVRDWLAARWAGGQASPPTLADLRPQFRQFPSQMPQGMPQGAAHQIRIDWTEIATESSAVPRASGPASTDAFLAARLAADPVPVTFGEAGARPERDPTHTPESSRSHGAPQPLGTDGQASAASADPGDLTDSSHQQGAGATGQPDLASARASAMTGQQLSEKFGELLGKRMMQQIESGNWKVDVKLHPEDLGSIQVEMTWKDGQLEAVLSADHPGTRELMDQGLSKLRESLLNNGTNLAYLAVGDERRRQGHGQQKQGQDRALNLEEDVGAEEPDQPERRAVVSGRLDILA